MRFGINAHLLSFSQSYRQAGLSRYIYEIVTRAPLALPQDKFSAFVGDSPVPAEFKAAMPPNLRLMPSRWPTERAPVRIGWEQSVLPVASLAAKLDLVHCPVNVRPFFSLAPTIVTIHDLIFLRYPRAFHPAKRLYLTVMTGWSARNATHLIAVSEATRRDVLELLHVRPNRVTTVQNGVGDSFKPASSDDIERFRREKGLGGRVILYVGTIEPRKNIETAIRAFRQIAHDPDMDDVTFLIGGSKGWYYDRIMREAEQGDLMESGRIRFLGRVPDDELPLWYNAATLFVYPSRYEGFGLPALEAMSCGAPVLVSTTPALREVVGDAGILVEPDDVERWAEAIGGLLRGEERRREMRALSLEQAAHFSWQKSAEETAQLYRKVAIRWRRKG